MRTASVVGVLLVAALLWPGAVQAQRIPVPRGNVDAVEVVRFYVLATMFYPTTNQFQSGSIVTGGTIHAQSTKVYLGIQNKTGATLTNVEWRIHRAAGGPASLDSGVQSVASIAPSQTGWVQVNVPWQAAGGSYQLVGSVDPNRKIGESESMRTNNAKVINLTVDKIAWVDPAQAGAPQNVSLNVEAGLCQGDVSVTTSELKLSLRAPYPVPIPFPGCVMRPEFYKGSQLRHGWTIIGTDFPDAIGNYPPPPPSTYAWITRPSLSGTVLRGQVSLSLPSRSTPCSSSNPCLSLVSRFVKVRIRGPAEHSPHPTLQELLRIR